MPDFKNFSNDPNSPAVAYSAITPADADLARPIRAFYVGGAGDITLTSPAGNVVTLVGLLAGVVYPFAAVRISATGTSASNIVGIE